MQLFNFLKFFQTFLQVLTGIFGISGEMDFDAECFLEFLEIMMENLLAFFIGYFIWKTVKTENIEIKCKNLENLYIFLIG